MLYSRKPNLIVWIALILLPGTVLAELNPVEIMSKRGTAVLADGSSSSPAITASATGRYVAFESLATNLTFTDTNGLQDIFVRDREELDTILISIDSTGGSSNGASSLPSISADGNLVAFQSMASDLVLLDENELSDIFVRDIDAETTTRVSVSNIGDDSNGASSQASISANGQFVAFASDADNLVLNDDNDVTDIFVRDLDTETTTRVSISSALEEGNGPSTNPAISADGRYVVFQSAASNLVILDENDKIDIFLHDRQAGTTIKISNDNVGGDSDGDSLAPRITLDGTMIVFQSTATDLVLNDNNEVSDVFLYTTGEGIVRASITETAEEANGASMSPSISGDGAFVVFESIASDMVDNDDNGVSDIFSYKVEDESIALLSVSESSEHLTKASVAPQLNSNANFVTFVTDDSELGQFDNNNALDVYLLNTQCILAPDGVTPEDADSDGTDDCDDECPTDPDKIVPGECGCGEADEDSDSDGTLDCNDLCPQDPLKTELGLCGCGISDDDENGNDVADCLDPTEESTPLAPFVVRKKKKDRVVILIPTQFENVEYRIVVKRGRSRYLRRTTDKMKLRLRDLPKGRYRVFYKVRLPGGGASQKSPTVRFRVK